MGESMHSALRRCSLQARRALVALALIAYASARAHAQAPAASTGGIQGTVSTQDGTVRLPGVLISLLQGSSPEDVTSLASDESGHFTIPDLKPGRYRVRASL